MPSLELRSTHYRLVFRFRGKKYSHTLKTNNRHQAEILLGGVEKTLWRLEQGLLELPLGADIVSFVLTDGKVSHKPEQAKVLTLETLCNQFQNQLPLGAMEENSLATLLLHLKHFERILGTRFNIGDLKLEQLQNYVQQRSQEQRGNKLISPVTIRKEITSLAGVWNWGCHMGYMTGSFPSKGLRFPKTKEKPPFQTWTEIERQIARGGLEETEQAELWDCLFLTLPEIAELMDFINANARHAFLYPMAVFAAHTGARRSEIMRSRITDFDFGSQTVLIHEKKRVKGKQTTRRVPLSPLLFHVMEEWFSQHPGGVYTICQELHVAQANKTRTEHGPLTRNEANHHLQRTLAGGKWEKLRGWHVFRHSFCSNCAATGIDQRIINAWVGHQTEEMVRRYRHLIPDQQQKAIQLVFGQG
ncbi:MAG: tyrosine-type recombinase/integrase [Bdellovibrionales bacterium]